MLGQERPELDNLTVCDKFKPIILESQLCYSLDVSKYTNQPTKMGKKHGLFLLVDPTLYQTNSNERNVEAELNVQDSFKVYIHTLAQHAEYGPGAYAMYTLKSMAGTKSFEQLPESQKKCRVHNREKCQTNKFLEQVKHNCSCVPWSLQNEGSKEKVIFYLYRSTHFSFLQQAFCGPEEETCVARQTLKDNTCLVPCTGLYADVYDKAQDQKITEALEHKTMEGAHCLIFQITSTLPFQDSVH